MFFNHSTTILNTNFFVSPTKNNLQFNAIELKILTQEDSKPNFLIIPLPYSILHGGRIKFYCFGKTLSFIFLKKKVKILNSKSYPEFWNDCHKNFDSEKQKLKEDERVYHYKEKSNKILLAKDFQELFSLQYTTKTNEKIKINAKNTLIDTIYEDYNSPKFCFLVVLYKNSSKLIRLRLMFTTMLMKDHLFVPAAIAENKRGKNHCSIFSINTNERAGVSREIYQNGHIHSPLPNFNLLPAKISDVFEFRKMELFKRGISGDQLLDLSLDSIFLEKVKECIELKIEGKIMHYFSILFSKNTPNPRAFVIYADFMASVGDLTSAEKFFKIALDFTPNDSHVHHRFALYLESQKKYQKSEK